MTDEDRAVLEDEGWSIDCDVPFEISKGESFARWEAAELVLAFLKHYRETYNEKYDDAS